MKRMVKFGTILVTAAAIAASVACNEVKGEARPEPRPVKLLEAKAPEVPNGARYAVNIQPYEQIALSFKGSGYVDSVLRRKGADGRSRPLQAGDYVTAGTTVARVRQEDYRERVSQAAFSLQELEIAQAKAKIDLERALFLFGAGAMTRPERDAAQAAFDQGAARIAAAKTQLNLATNALHDASLVAPVSGVVLERKIETGTLVNVGSVGFMLGDVSAVKAIFGVPDSVVHRIAPGQRLTVTTEAFHGSQFEGTVTTVAPSADSQTRVFDIEVTIPNRDGRLRPGMIGAVELSAGAEPTAVGAVAALPLSAIVRSPKHEGQYTVFVVDGAGDELAAQARAVTLGPVQGNLVTVTSGLKAGERVIVMGAGVVNDGEMVRVIR
jgi:RND family efflux transporter MFP subunit